MKPEDLPCWNLTDLYENLDDPRINTDIARFIEMAAAFAERRKGTIATSNLTSDHLRDVVTEYEMILDGVYRLSAFASLMFATRTNDPECGALLQRVRESASTVYTSLIFVELEIGRIPDTTFSQLAAEKSLQPYHHYLTHQRRLAQHYLSEPEERILIETSNVRGAAFARLFTEISARTRYNVTTAGETRELNQSETLTLLYDADRNVRAAAATAVTTAMKENSHTGTFIYNTLLHEKAITDRLRGYREADSSRHLANALPAEIVETVVGVCEKNYSLVHDYYSLKRRLLGLDTLTHYDRYAPLDLDTGSIPFSDAHKLVIDAFDRFSPEMAEMAQQFFDRHWIDAAPADGKQGGAFCAGVTPTHHPYILLNYTGKPRDVTTLAHELGHGIHDLLASGNSLLNYHPVLPMAETASTFAEMLVFERLRRQTADNDRRLAMICNKIEDSFATVFRQAAMYRFEQRAHRLRREAGEQRTESYNEIWQSSMQAMFGNALDLGADHGWWWLYIPHIVRSPFYVYAYAFGELLVLSLFAQYQEQGEPFVPRYLQMLRDGGARPPVQLAAGMGIDMHDPAFWQGGCDLIRTQIDEAVRLAKHKLTRTAD